MGVSVSFTKLVFIYHEEVEMVSKYLKIVIAKTHMATLGLPSSLNILIFILYVHIYELSSCVTRVYELLEPKAFYRAK